MPCTACKESTHTKQTCPYLVIRGERVFQTVLHELKTSVGGDETQRYEHAKKFLGKLRDADLALLAKRLEPQLGKNDAYMISAGMYSASELTGIFGSLVIRLGRLFSLTDFDSAVFQTDQFIHPVVTKPILPAKRQKFKDGSKFQLKVRIEDSVFEFLNEDGEDTCPICIDTLKKETVCRQSCGHLLCSSCFVKSFIVKKIHSCCLCRDAVATVKFTSKKSYDKFTEKYCGVVV